MGSCADLSGLCGLIVARKSLLGCAGSTGLKVDVRDRQILSHFTSLKVDVRDLYILRHSQGHNSA